MKSLSRSVMVVVAAVWGGAVPATAQLTTNTTVVLERQVTNGVRLQVLRESVVLVSEEDLAKRQPRRVLWTNYIDGKPKIQEATEGTSIPIREDTFYVVWIDGNRTNVNRTRYLKKVLFSLQPPWARLLDVLDEPPRTFYLHTDYPGPIADEVEGQLVVTIVAEDRIDGREKVRIQEFVLWMPTNTTEVLESARLQGSFKDGTLSVQMTVASWGPGGIPKPYTRTLWFRGYTWYPRPKPPPARGDSRR